LGETEDQWWFEIPAGAFSQGTEERGCRIERKFTQGSGGTGFAGPLGAFPLPQERGEAAKRRRGEFRIQGVCKCHRTVILNRGFRWARST
jgi:hypothetical protein